MITTIPKSVTAALGLCELSDSHFSSEMVATSVNISFLQRYSLAWIAGVLGYAALALSTCQAAEPAPNAPSQSASSEAKQTYEPPQRSVAGGGLRLQGVSMSPFSRPRPGHLFTVRAGVANTSAEEQAGMVLARLDRVPDLQAAAEVRVPPGESRIVDLHLRIPADFAPGSNFDLSFSLNALDGQRVLLNSSGKPQIDSLRMMLDSEQLVTGVMLANEPPHAPDWYWPYDERLMSYECAVAARIDSGHNRQTLAITQENVPAQLIDWEGFDTFVIAQDGPLRDPVAMEAMGRWIAAGGRAWVMLDQIGQDDLSFLLPDGMACEAIDDIELNEFVVEADLALSISDADRTVVSDQPMRLRRAVQNGGKVTHRINGFPAAIWFQIGKGQLLVTTLDARGWMTPRTGEANLDPLLHSDFQMRVWSKPMAEQFFEGADPRSPLDVAQVDYPLKQIGNPVLNRNFVISIVFGFCGLLALSGWWCWHTGALTRMGWLVPVLSIAAAVPLLVASNRVRRDMPDTSAHLQVIEVQPGSRLVQGSQWTATYMSRSSSGELVADGDALVSWPDTGGQNDLRRWLWDDYQHWQLSSTGWPHGLWRLNSRFNLPPRQLDVIARLDDQGVALELPAELGEPLQDAVLCYVPGDVAVCNRLDSDRAARVSDAHVTIGQSWLGSTIVNDEQARRDDVYRLLPSRTATSRYPSYPALLGWTKLWKTPLAWSESRDERGSALVALPIKLLPVPSGETVHVPHTLVRAETPAEGAARSTAFINHTGLWREETTLAMQVPMRFHLPLEVCPLEASELVLDLQMRAPQRDVRVVARAGGKETVVAEYRSPLAAERIRITDPAILADAQDGSVDFRLDVSQPTGQAAAEMGAQIANWQVDYFRLSADGRVAER